MSRIKGFFKENLGLKIIALFLAIVLEIYFYSPDNSITSTMRVRIDIVGLPPSFIVTEPYGNNGILTASVELRGPKTLIEQVRSTASRFRVTVPPGKVSQFSATLDERQLSLPSGVQVLRINPERITVKAEPEVKKELLVVLDKRGTVPEGYRLEDVRLFPDSVVVRGPASKMDGLQAVETVAVDIDGLKETVESELSLKDLGEHVSASVNMVRAKIEISPIPQQRVFEELQVQVLAPKGYAASLESSKASIVLGGPQEVIEAIVAEELQLTADARSLKSGTHKVVISANVPDKVTILSTEPARVEVRLTASDTNEKSAEVK